MSKSKQLKNYNILVTGYSSVLVLEAENEDHAYELAQEELSMGDFEIDSLQIECEVPEEEIENYRSHANCVSESL
jgi:hypothetical protein